MAERRGALWMGDRVLFEGAEHQVVGLPGTSVRLLSDAGQATVVARPFLLAAADFAVVRAGAAVHLRPVMAPHGLLDALPWQVVRCTPTLVLIRHGPDFSAPLAGLRGLPRFSSLGVSATARVSSGWCSLGCGGVGSGYAP